MYEFDWKVRAADTDFSGRVYTPAVLDYTVRAINQFMEDGGHSAYQLQDREGIVYPVRAAEVEYLAPMATGDETTIALTHETGETSVRFDATGRRDGEDVFRATLTVVFVDTETGDAVSIPDHVREYLGQ